MRPAHWSTFVWQITYMNRLRGLALLMGVAILGITGFQVYWLKDNYAREKKSLLLKAESAFRETMMELQVSKLKLDDGIPGTPDSMNGNVKVFMNDYEKEVKVTYRPKKEIVSTIKMIQDKVRDSIKTFRELPSGLVISMNKSGGRVRGDSMTIQRHLPPAPGGRGDRIFSLLYGVDSLQDSLRVSEIDSAYSRRLKEDKINIPYTIIRTMNEQEKPEPDLSAVTVGLAHPITYRVKEGNTFPYLLKKISLPILFSVILIGITILSFVLLYRNMLKQRRLAALKNEFISNITHELKTPIATVGVAIEALKNFNAIQDPRRTKEYLDISSNELQRLGFLVDKVLKLSMFEKKQVELKPEPVNMRELVNEVVESLKLQLEKNEATVEVVQHGNVELEGDRLNLLSVIFNLLDNALKYSKEKPAIRISLEEKDNSVQMMVSDHGIGIPAAYREKIFEKFFRVPQGNVHNAKGYGLGLSYAAEVIRKHHGHIRVESNDHGGSTFIISLPKNRI